MTVDFDAFIGGGTGADGMTFTIQNAAATGASPTKLGVRGGGLGFSGISGIAAALVEYRNSVNPSNNFAGITDGPIAGAPTCCTGSRPRTSCRDCRTRPTT